MQIQIAIGAAMQVERLTKRDGCTRELAEAKIGSQMPQESKRRRSQYVVDNSGSHSSTRDQACASPCTSAPTADSIYSTAPIEFV